MAFFNYDRPHSKKDVFDWVLAEIAVCRQYDLMTMAKFLNIHQTMLNLSHYNKTKEIWTPVVPDDEKVRVIKRNMQRFAKKVLAEMHRNDSDIANSTDHAADVQFQGRSDRCPECNVVKTHLKAHLMSSQHSWSEEEYDRWKSTKARVQVLPEKYCHHKGEGCASTCMQREDITSLQTPWLHNSHVFHMLKDPVPVLQVTFAPRHQKERAPERDCFNLT